MAGLFGRIKAAFKPSPEAVAGPSLAGVRQVWTDSLAKGMTPEKLSALLEAANQGDGHDYLTLAEEMEERDPHYAAVLGTRKRAVSALPRVVEAASESKHDQMLADEVRKLVKAPAFAGLLEDLLDGLGKSYSVCAIEFNSKKAPWVPVAYPHRDPRWFQFDRLSLSELRIRDESDPDGLEIQPGHLICHVPHLKTGIPLRGGLARVVAFAWLCKAYAQKDWMAFAEVFGLPLRLGKFDSNASKEDKAALRRAVANLGTDAAGIMPRSMEIEFIQASNSTGGADLFKNACEYFDKQISKAVLGQTMTTDDGASLSQAKVHDEVRDDILRADAQQLSATINRDLIRPFIIWNWGEQEEYPEFQLQVVEPEDLTALADNLVKLVPLGLEVEQSVIRDKLGLPDPEDGAKLLSAPKVHQPTAPDEIETATNRAKPEAPTTADLQTDQLAAKAQPHVGAMLEQIEAMMKGADSLEEFRDRLLAAYPDLNDSPLVDALAEGMTAADIAGITDISQTAGQVE